MEEAIFREMLEKLGIEDLSVESAGVNQASAGQPIAPFSAQELRNRGINHDRHTSRYVGDIGPLDDFIRIICVGDKEAATLTALFPDVVNRTSVMPIDNPWEKGEEAYRLCAIQIEELMGALVDSVVAEIRR
jgi:protein-tyrosine-phosphatase